MVSLRAIFGVLVIAVALADSTQARELQGERKEFPPQVFHFEREGAGQRDCFSSSLLAVAPFFPLDLVPFSFLLLPRPTPPRKKNKNKKPKTTDFNTTALLSDAQAKLSGIQEQVRTFSFFIERGETERGRERERQRGRE